MGSSHQSCGEKARKARRIAVAGLPSPLFLLRRNEIALLPKENEIEPYTRNKQESTITSRCGQPTETNMRAKLGSQPPRPSYYNELFVARMNVRSRNPAESGPASSTKSHSEPLTSVSTHASPSLPSPPAAVGRNGGDDKSTTRGRNGDGCLTIDALPFPLSFLTVSDRSKRGGARRICAPSSAVSTFADALVEGAELASPSSSACLLGAGVDVVDLTSCKCALLAHRFADFGTGPTPPNPCVMLPEFDRWMPGRAPPRNPGDAGTRWMAKWRLVGVRRAVGVCGRTLLRRLEPAAWDRRVRGCSSPMPPTGNTISLPVNTGRA